jgi:hypothetical protein
VQGSPVTNAADCRYGSAATVSRTSPMRPSGCSPSRKAWPTSRQFLRRDRINRVRKKLGQVGVRRFRAGGRLTESENGWWLRFSANRA